MNNEDKQLLNNFLSNTCTPEELVRIKKLLEEPSAGQALHQLMIEREKFYEQAIKDEEISEKMIGWEQHILERIATEQKTGENPDRRFIPKIRRLVYAAASVLIMLITSYYLFQHTKDSSSVPNEITFIQKVNYEGFPVEYILPDGTSVHLGAGADITYPEKFENNTREISLNGEAFFEVARDTAKPFVVKTGNIQTRVLGTSFKIEAFKNHPLTVAVATGKVGVSAITAIKKEELSTLIPGDKLVYDVLNGSFYKKQVQVSDLLQWTEGDLVFDEQKLELVALKLENRYGVTIRFEKKTLAAYKISGSFDKKQNIRTVIKMLSIIGNFNYTFNNNSINIY